MFARSIEPIGLLEASWMVQDQLVGLNKQEATEAWYVHRPLIGTKPSLAGTRRVHVRTETAVMLADGLSAEEAIYPMLQYGELALKGFLSDIKMVHFNGSATVMWMLSDAVLRDTHLREVELSDDMNDLVNPLPVGVPIRRPLYAPAKLISFAIPAE